MSSIFYAWNLRYTWGSWLHCHNHHAETPNRLWQTFYFNIVKRNPNIWRHIWIVWLILKWLPWHLNQINGFQLGKLEWHNTGNVTRGLLGCKGHVAMTTGRQAPKLRQKKEEKKGGKDGCHGMLIIEDGADGEWRAWLPVGCWVPVILLLGWLQADRHLVQQNNVIVWEWERGIEQVCWFCSRLSEWHLPFLL